MRGVCARAHPQPHGALLRYSYIVLRSTLVANRPGLPALAHPGGQARTRAPGNRALALSFGAPPARRGAAIRAIPGKAKEGASLVGWRPTTTPPGAALGGAAGSGLVLSPRAQQSCCWVLLLTYGVRHDRNDRRAGPSHL